MDKEHIMDLISNAESDLTAMRQALVDMYESAAKVVPEEYGQELREYQLFSLKETLIEMEKHYVGTEQYEQCHVIKTVIDTFNWEPLISE